MALEPAEGLGDVPDEGNIELMGRCERLEGLALVRHDRGVPVTLIDLIFEGVAYRCVRGEAFRREVAVESLFQRRDPDHGLTVVIDSQRCAQVLGRHRGGLSRTRVQTNGPAVSSESNWTGSVERSSSGRTSTRTRPRRAAVRFPIARTS